MSEFDVKFRPARAEDAVALAPFVYDSGNPGFDFVFSHRTRLNTVGYLERALAHSGGEFGYGTHHVAEFEGAIVAAGGCYNGHEAKKFLLPVAGSILRNYGLLEGIGVIRRGLAIERVLKQPAVDEHMLLHISVDSDMRGRGIGAGLVRHLLQLGRDAGSRTAVLDVAADNPRAEALYERLGFRVTREVRSTLSNSTSTVPDFHRMEMPLD